MPITYSSRAEIEVHRFTLSASIGIPLVALLLQAFVPLYVRRFDILDLPLLVTIFLAVARRSPVTGLLTGGVIGLLQDGLTHHPLGVYGIAKTVVGYAASSLGVRVDVESVLTRFLTTLGFYLLHTAVYFVVGRYLVRQPLEWEWGYLLVASLLNALVALPLFAFLDRFKHKT